MGKRGKKHKKKGLSGETKSQAVAEKGNVKKTGKYSIDQLLDKAEDYVDTFEFELAQKFCQRALELDADNVRALETSGSLLLELGNVENAKHCFGRAVELQPEEGHAKYMYLGQLFTGQQAIQCFQKGVELMSQKLDEQDSLEKGAGACAEEEGMVKQADISNAYCSMAEIYLTDECFEEEADVKCKECLDKSVSVYDSNPDSYQLLASYWLSKDDKEKAKENIEKSVTLWLPELQRLAEEPEGIATDPIQVCPVSFPARLQAAKTLIEVESYDVASEILELLLDEDDEVVEVWYLLGWLNFLQGEEYHGNARDYLQKADKVKAKVGCDDAQLVQHVEELLKELGPGETEEEDNADAEEIDLENYESEDDMDVESNVCNGSQKPKLQQIDSVHAMEH